MTLVCTNEPRDTMSKEVDCNHALPQQSNMFRILRKRTIQLNTANILIVISEVGKLISVHMASSSK